MTTTPPTRLSHLRFLGSFAFPFFVVPGAWLVFLIWALGPSFTVAALAAIFVGIVVMAWSL